LNIPFVIYDFLGVLFPGALVLILAANAFGQSSGQIGNVVAGLPANVSLAVIAAYLSGHLAEALGRSAFHIALGKRYDKQTSSQRLSTEAGLGKDIADRVLDSIGQKYGLDARTLSSRDLFDLAYSPVYNRMGKYDIFTANADMARTLLVVAALFLLECIGGSFGWIHVTFPSGSVWQVTACLLGTLVAMALLYRDESFYRVTAHRVVYTAFLSWVGEGQARPQPK
jgi:hypothetical protein